MTDPARTVVAVTSWMNDANARLPAALRNLAEIQPGYPTSTPGSGSVGGSGTSSSSSVERLAGRLTDDEAYRDLARVRELIRTLERQVSEFHQLTMKWGYRTAGESPAGYPVRQVRPTEHDTSAGQWCTSHARIPKAVPISSMEGGRVGLCGWCYEFKRHYEILPPLDLLDLHDRGSRVYEHVARRSVAVAMQADGVTKPKGKRKAKR